MTQKLKFQIGILILSIAFVSSSGYALYLSAVNGKQSANLVINKDNIARLELQNSEMEKTKKFDTDEINQTAIEYAKLKQQVDLLQTQVLAFSKQAMACEVLKTHRID